MIKNGYYYPTEMYRDLNHINPITGKVEGKAQLGICFGNRTGGKTVGHGIELIKRFEERGETNMLLARTQKQLEEGYLCKWWENKILNVDDDEGIISNFKRSHEIKITPRYVTVDEKPFSYCESISMSHKVKDEGAYHKCTAIIMDEAVQFGERIMYSNGRPMMVRIFEIWQTVARGWEEAVDATCLIFLANTSERDNWIFRDLGINSFVRKDTKYTVQNGIVFQMVANKIASKKVEDSFMGMVMKRSESGRIYYESAQNNEFNDNTSFVNPIGLDFNNLKLQLVCEYGNLGVFDNSGSLHIAKIHPDERSRRICNNTDYHSINTEYIPYGGWNETLKASYEKGIVTFQSLEDKNAFLYYMGYIN